MSKNNVAIQIDSISKKYTIGQINGGTLQESLQSWWARLRKKEDPNIPVNFDSRLIGRTFWALNGVSFTVNSGDSIGIIGRNGAGKSTLLKILSRVTGPTSGTVGINGRIASMLEVGTGFSPEMTGRENIYMNGAILGMTRTEIDQRIDAIIEFSECSDFIDTPVKRYSSGMYVKLAFSVAAHLDNEILIMDEVLAVGDASFQKKCLDRMYDLTSNNGRTILYVSHNMATIRRLCNRCVVLDAGKVVFDGDVEEGISHYLGTTKSLDSEKDLSVFKRSERNLVKSPTVRMQRIWLVDRDTPIFDQGEKMSFRLEFLAEDATNDMALFVVIKTVGGNPIGSSYTDNTIHLPSGTSSFVFSLDTSSFVEGRYIIDISLSKLANGNIYGYDVITDSYAFEIAGKASDVQSYPWNHTTMGNVLFPEIQFLSQDTNLSK